MKDDFVRGMLFVYYGQKEILEDLFFEIFKDSSKEKVFLKNILNGFKLICKTEKQYDEYKAKIIFIFKNHNRMDYQTFLIKF